MAAPKPEEISRLLKSLRAKVKRTLPELNINWNRGLDVVIEPNRAFHMVFFRYYYEPADKTGYLVYLTYEKEGKQKRTVPQWARQSRDAFLLWALRQFEIDSNKIA